MKVAVIIPAFNEEGRIARVLAAVSEAKNVHEIIVVCDGGTDGTPTVARSFPNVKVVELHFNLGKGGAMCMGVASTDADIVAFFDADLVGLKPEHVDKLIAPVITGLCGMSIGVFRGGKFWSDSAQRLSPYLSGQRVMHRMFFESIPYLSEIRMGVEVTLNTFAKRHKIRVLRVMLQGVSNTFKESKMGLVKGTAARARMYAEIGRAMVKVRRKRKFRAQSRK